MIQPPKPGYYLHRQFAMSEWEHAYWDGERWSVKRGRRRVYPECSDGWSELPERITKKLEQAQKELGHARDEIERLRRMLPPERGEPA